MPDPGHEAEEVSFRLTRDEDTDICYAYVPAEMNKALHLKMNSRETLVIRETGEDSEDSGKKKISGSFHCGEKLPVFPENVHYSFSILDSDENSLGSEEVVFIYTKGVPSMYIDTESGSMDRVDSDETKETAENADFLICEKKRTEHLFYTACNGTTPKGVTDVNENRELTVAGKRYIDFVSGNTTYAANGATVLEKAAPALSAVAMAAGGAVSGACGNIGVIGLASAVVSTLMPLTSYIAPVKNLFSKKDQRQNPLIQEMENLDGRHDDFDIGSYTDGNMDLVYGSVFSAGSSENSMKLDPVKSNISIESAASLHLVAGGKDLICVQNDSITVRTADDQSITITPKQITVKSGEFTAVVSPDAVKLGDNVTLKADSYTLFSLDVGSRKSFSN